MQLKMFVQTNAGVAAKPGTSQRNIRLVAVPPNADGTNDNSPVLAGPGGLVLDIQNASPELAAALIEGITVTLPIQLA